MKDNTKNYIYNIVDNFYDGTLNEYLESTLQNDDIEYLFDAVNFILSIDNESLNESFIFDQNELTELQEGIRDWINNTREDFKYHKLNKMHNKSFNAGINSALSTNRLNKDQRNSSEYQAILKDNKAKFKSQSKANLKAASNTYKDNRDQIQSAYRDDRKDLNYNKKQLKHEKRSLFWKNIGNKMNIFKRTSAADSEALAQRRKDIKNELNTKYNKKSKDNLYAQLSAQKNANMNKARNIRQHNIEDIRSQNNKNITAQKNMTADDAKKIIDSKKGEISKQDNLRDVDSKNDNGKTNNASSTLELNPGKSPEDLENESKEQNTDLNDKTESQEEAFSFETTFDLSDKYALYEILDMNGFIPNKLNMLLLAENMLLGNVFLFEYDTNLTENYENPISHLLEFNDCENNSENIELFEELYENGDILFY